MSLRSRHWDESKHKRDGQGQFAHTAGSAVKKAGGWLDKVGHAMEQRVGGSSSRGKNRVEIGRASKASGVEVSRAPKPDVEVSRAPNANKGRLTPEELRLSAGPRRNPPQRQSKTDAAVRELRGLNQDPAVRDAQIGAGIARARARASAPMTDDEYKAHTDMVTAFAMGPLVEKYATDQTHTDADGSWSKERRQMHEKIARELYAKAAHVPNERRAVIAGGLGGAGKTTVLKGHAGINPDDYLTLNPDDVKELMAERGLVPDVPEYPNLSPMERSTLIHEESGRITELMADMALRDGKNMMWDITMASGKSVSKRVNALKAAKFKEINAVFVDIPVEVSVKRAMGRYRSGADRYRAGKGLGGRFVPPHIIRKQRTDSGETVNRGVFEGLKDEFTNWSAYDNSVDGRAPQLIEKGKGGWTSAAQARAAAARKRSVQDFIMQANTPALPPAGSYHEWPLPQTRKA